MTQRGEGKGSVTGLGALFSAEETLKASNRVNDAIADRRRDLDRVQSFAADNSALAKLVRQLPDEISHDIMVPFGSAAFFPGRLIHTNEFLVLLGDGYYAERTSKQTVEILKRREKSLDSQIKALKASLLDLEAEAKFFDLTAAEAEVVKQEFLSLALKPSFVNLHEDNSLSQNVLAQGGIVEIREEYTEEPQAQQKDIVKIREEYAEEPRNASESEDEHARIMAKLDELEKEELEAESAHSDDEDEDPRSRLEAESASGSDEDEDLEAESTSGKGEDEDSDAGFGSCAPKNNVNDGKGKTSEKLKSMEPMQKSSGQELLQSTAKLMGSGSYQHFADHPSISEPNSKFHGGDGSIESNIVSSDVTCKPPLPPDSKKKLHNSSDLKLEDSTNNIASETGKMGFGERKAFTGSVIEHAHGLSSSQASKSTRSSDQPSKPVSRFKMMKGNR